MSNVINIRNKKVIFLFIVTILLFSLVVSYGQYLETVIPTGSYPQALEYNSTNRKAYCANMGSNNVTVVDVAANSAITTIRVGSEPRALVCNSTNNKIYCANQLSNDVTVINGATNEAINTIPVGNRPSALVWDSVNNKIYCANAGSNNVSVIDGTNDSVIAIINVGYYPMTLICNPTNNKIYCANMDSENISIIDGVTNQVISTIPTGRTPASMCYNSTNNKVYCASWSNGRIHIIDGATDQIIDSMIYGNSGPQALIYNKYSNQIYYTNYTDDNIKIINGANNTIVSTIQFPVGTRPYVLTNFYPSSFIFSGNLGSNSVSVISGTSIWWTINVEYPVALVAIWIPSAIRVYAANLWSSSISVIRINLPGTEEARSQSQEATSFEFYPNPARSLLTICCPLIADHQTLRMYDVSGKLVRVEELNKSKSLKEIKLPLKNINPGVYFLQLTNVPWIEKLVIAK
jgi:YVTN family beta-propeller protein